MRPGHGYSALRKQRTTASGYTYLVTSRAAAGRTLTSLAPVPEIICSNLLWLRDQGRMALQAFVLMPDHLHLIITPSDDQSLAQITHVVKGFSAQRVNSALGIGGSLWKAGYHERGIRDREAMRAAIEYVEENPVRAGLAVQPEQWPYSSANESFWALMDVW